jgi:hypothetical protein
VTKTVRAGLASTEIFNLTRKPGFVFILSSDHPKTFILRRKRVKIFTLSSQAQSR